MLSERRTGDRRFSGRAIRCGTEFREMPGLAGQHPEGSRPDGCHPEGSRSGGSSDLMRRSYSDPEEWSGPVMIPLDRVMILSGQMMILLGSMIILSVQAMLLSGRKLLRRRWESSLMRPGRPLV